MKHTTKKQNYIQMEFPNLDELIRNANPPEPAHSITPLHAAARVAAEQPCVDEETYWNLDYADEMAAELKSNLQLA